MQSNVMEAVRSEVSNGKGKKEHIFIIHPKQTN